MMVVDASTLAVVGGLAARQAAVAHWYQLGEAAGAGFTPLAALYREGRGARAPRTCPPTTRSR